MAEKSKLEFGEINGSARLIIDRNDQGMPWMSEVELNFNLVEVQDPTRAFIILEKTKQSAMIHNSVKSKIEYCFRVNSSS